MILNPRHRKKLNIIWGVVCVFIIINILSVVTLSDIYGLYVRRELVYKTMPAIGDRSYELQTYGELLKPEFTYAGWRYLFKHYGKTPSKSNVDPVLGWIYQDEISKDTPELRVVVADTVIPKFEIEPIATFQSGVYTSYVFNNQLPSNTTNPRSKNASQVSGYRLESIEIPLQNIFETDQILSEKNNQQVKRDLR